MEKQLFDVAWLDAREAVTLAELAQICAMSVDELDELTDYGVLVPMGDGRQERLFSAECVVPLRTAGKLRQDFDLDLFTVGLMLGYLNRIEALEHQLLSLQAQLPGNAPAEPR
ncbi:chaperone modulator CbpM [Polaromonas sp.]|uniref:chaperone modulator CbpM n=1 Tax=Polaromonas sp. TaxID=1869339 RepID=UPI002488BECC|nr:chaperone modulator CbpM [Polaromonas sp.]MDI1339410.1 chaperone modulator CbpM [Polaromonas sp.]